MATRLNDVPRRLQRDVNWWRLAAHLLLFPLLLSVVIVCAIGKIWPVYPVGQLLYDSPLIQALPPGLEDLAAAVLLAAVVHVAVTVGYRQFGGGDESAG